MVVKFSLFLCFLGLFACSEIKEFSIEVDPEVIADLHQRLRLTRWPNEIEDLQANEQGLRLEKAKDLADHWLNKYDWSETQERLNKYPHFITQIQGLDIHFIHKRSEHEDAQPLLFVHGWPGSFLECLDAMDLLTNPKEGEQAFHVVCPSLPGYGFSSPPKKLGMDSESMAKIFIDLMEILEYKQYMAQGGDWGCIITTDVARLDSNCNALHLNGYPFGPPTSKGFIAAIKTFLQYWKPTWFLDPLEIEAMTDVSEIIVESGYFHEQATKPQTLGYGLNDSPVGLMAWIVEKVEYWSDCKGDILNCEPYTRDKLLDNVMLYWVSQTGPSSIRLYWEQTHKHDFLSGSANIQVDIPTAFIRFKKELLKGPRAWMSYFYTDIVHVTDVNSGGHFAGWEQPARLVQDIRDFAAELKDREKAKKEL